MRRVIAAFRLLSPKRHDVGPLRVTADSDVGAEGVGRILDTVYIATSKVREFGFRDSDVGGGLHILARKSGESAHGRYLPGSDQMSLFYPHARGVEDWLWTIVHEIGHRVWHKVLQPVDRELWTQVVEATGQPFSPEAASALIAGVGTRPQPSPLWFFFQKRYGNDVNGFREWLMTRRYSEELPTTYSMSTATEAFADVFAEAVLARPHAGMGLRRTGAYIKGVFASLTAPYRNKGALVSEQQDAEFLTSQVDTPALAGPIASWVAKNLDGSAVLDLERRPHVTLVYGLDRRDLPQIQRVASDFGRHIRLVPGALNYFDNPEHDVLYFEALGNSVVDLHQSLIKLPNTRDQSHTDFVPHITVAYMKKGTAKKYVGQSPLRAIVTRTSFTVIDQAGIETPMPTIPEEQKSQDPMLFADAGVRGIAG